MSSGLLGRSNEYHGKAFASVYGVPRSWIEIFPNFYWLVKSTIIKKKKGGFEHCSEWSSVFCRFSFQPTSCELKVNSWETSRLVFSLVGGEGAHRVVFFGIDLPAGGRPIEEAFSEK